MYFYSSNYKSSLESILLIPIKYILPLKILNMNEITNVTILGSGQMGAGIGLVCAIHDYNVVFLPETQEIKLSFEKIKVVNDLDNIGYRGFFLDISGQDIFISSKKGKFFKLNINNLHKSELKRVVSSQKFNVILDILILDDYIYVSNVTSENKCNKYSGISTTLL